MKPATSGALLTYHKRKSIVDRAPQLQMLNAVVKSERHLKTLQPFDLLRF
jgi:hypothetical protein